MKKNLELLSPQILIVGAGPVGVALAVGLKRSGYDVLLVERAPKVGRHFKGEYLQPMAGRLFRALGLTSIFTKPSSAAITELRFHDLDVRGGVRSELLMPYPEQASALSIAHHELLEGLWEDARQRLGENFWTGVTLKLENETSPDCLRKPIFSAEHPTFGQVQITPQWVIGCDGRISTVRKWMGGAKAPKTAPVTWLAGDEFIVGAEVRQPAPISNRYEVIRSYERGTVSAFSLGQLGQRIYYSATDMDSNLNTERRSEINSLLEQASPLVQIGTIDEKKPLTAFPAYTANFHSTANGRFLLAGDACNVTTPFGGQGISSGMEHVRHLLAHFDFTTDNDLQVKHYEDNVDGIFSRISLINFGLYYLFFARAPMFKMTSAHIVNHWEANPELKERVMRLFGGMDTDRPQVLELMKLWGINSKTVATGIVPQRLIQRLSGW